MLSFQTCGSLAQGQWGRKSTRVLVSRLHLPLAVKRIMLDNLCVGAYTSPSVADVNSLRCATTIAATKNRTLNVISQKHCINDEPSIITY